MPQRLYLIGALSVRDNLRLAQYLAGAENDAARVDELLRAVGVADLAHRLPRELSQGQAQRVAIARATINRPLLLLADEPTANLDDAHAAAAIGLLCAQARASGATLVVASHDARDAVGIDLVVGAKGSPLQLVLAGIYHADVPPGNVPLAAVEDLRRNPLVRQVIPLALGDAFRGFRIVGTEPAFLDHYRAVLAQGRVWAAPLEAVLGHEVARASGLGAGTTFAGSHGLGESGAEHGDAAYRVVGVLAPNGGVIDRLVLTSIATVWEVHGIHHDDDHAAESAKNSAGKEGAAKEGAAKDEAAKDGAAKEGAEPLREVTLALVKYVSPLAAAGLPRAINAETVLQAASPAYESARLLTVFGVGTDVIRGFALLLIASAAVGLFVALTQALDERRYDLAIMRALGAPRGKVVAVLLIESVLLAAAGLAIGLAAGHALAAGVGRWLPAAAPLAAGAWTWQPGEWGIVALALGASMIATLLPAWRAYRLDVAATLAER